MAKIKRLITSNIVEDVEKVNTFTHISGSINCSALMEENEVLSTQLLNAYSL